MRIGYYGLYEEEEDSLTVQEPDATKQVHAYDKIQGKHGGSASRAGKKSAEHSYRFFRRNTG